MPKKIARRSPFRLRSPRPGDIGWVIHRHGVLYAREYGWDQRFEALVAEIAARFIRNFDAERERCWIAEQHGGPVGCVFLAKKSPRVAQLRMMLVEPKVRGHGLGARLVDGCIQFARQAGYRKMILWTNSELHPARRLYERAGFLLVHSEPYDGFGRPSIAETWELSL